MLYEKEEYDMYKIKWNEDTMMNSERDETGKSGERRYENGGWNLPEVRPTKRPCFSIFQKIKATAVSTHCLDLPTVCVDA